MPGYVPSSLLTIPNASQYTQGMVLEINEGKNKRLFRVVKIIDESTVEVTPAAVSPKLEPTARSKPKSEKHVVRRPDAPYRDIK